jgi:hypothetical protein
MKETKPVSIDDFRRWGAIGGRKGDKQKKRASAFARWGRHKAQQKKAA